MRARSNRNHLQTVHKMNAIEQTCPKDDQLVLERSKQICLLQKSLKVDAVETLSYRNRMSIENPSSRSVKIHSNPDKHSR